MKLSISDIAKEADVSRQEVSNVCGSLKDIKEMVCGMALERGSLLTSIQAYINGDAELQQLSPNIISALEGYNASSSQ